MGTIQELATAIEALITHPDLPKYSSVSESFKCVADVSQRAKWIYIDSDNPGEFYNRFTLVQSLSDELLITTDGRPDYENHNELKKLGYPVGPGEQDSFGWLSGIIRTPKGRIVFG